MHPIRHPPTCAAAVKGMPEEVEQDGLAALLHAAKRARHVRLDLQRAAARHIDQTSAACVHRCGRRRLRERSPAPGDSPALPCPAPHHTPWGRGTAWAAPPAPAPAGSRCVAPAAAAPPPRSSSTGQRQGQSGMRRRPGAKRPQQLWWQAELRRQVQPRMRPPPTHILPHTLLYPPSTTHSTCVYLSMNISALGTLWSPRCTTEEPTQEPSRRWQRARIVCIARPTAAGRRQQRQQQQ